MDTIFDLLKTAASLEERGNARIEAATKVRQNTDRFHHVEFFWSSAKEAQCWKTYTSNVYRFNPLYHATFTVASFAHH
jgi:hypothetical protein